MERIVFGRLISEREGRNGTLEEQMSRGRQKDLCHLSWYTVVCMFSLSVLGGLIITAAQIEMSLTRKAREHVVSRMRAINGRNRIPGQIELDLRRSE